MSLQIMKIIILHVVFFITIGTFEAVLADDNYKDFDDKKKQMAIMQAKIFFRQGFYLKSLQIYETIHKLQPNDKEIWINYIETLIQMSQYQKAENEVDERLKKSPDDFDTNRLKILLLFNQKKYEQTVAIFDHLIEHGSSDGALLRDYAYARQQTGDLANAYEYYCRAYETEKTPFAKNHFDAIDPIHQILLMHSPRLTTSFKHCQMPEDNTKFAMLSANYRYPLDYYLKMDMKANYIHLEHYPIKSQNINKKIEQLDLGVDYQTLSARKGKLGIGLYKGSAYSDESSFSFFTGFNLPIIAGVYAGADLEMYRPWYDPVDALNYDGRINKGALFCEGRYESNWHLRFEASQHRYLIGRIDALKKYGEKNALSFLLNRIISNYPETSFQYAFYFNEFRFENEKFTPIPMIEKEIIHAVSGSIGAIIRSDAKVTFICGLQNDAARSRMAWRAGSELEVHMNRVFTITLHYDYLSESHEFDGGQSHTFSLTIENIF